MGEEKHLTLKYKKINGGTIYLFFATIGYKIISDNQHETGVCKEV